MASIGLEPTTYGLEDRCSIQLSYEAIIGASGGSRTHTSIRITDFKSVASTVPPHSLYYCIKAQVVNCVKTLNVFLKLFFGLPGKIRTSDLQFRKLTLYPTELRAVVGWGRWIRTTDVGTKNRCLTTWRYPNGSRGWDRTSDLRLMSPAL